MNYQNNGKNNNAGFDAANFRIEAPVLPYSDDKPQFQIAAEPQVAAQVGTQVITPVVTTSQAPAPQKRQRTTRQRTNTANSKSSRHQVSHPELVRILMTSQTNAMPASPTNPASAKVRPTAPIARGRVASQMNAQQMHMAQQMDREKQMVLRGLGIVVGLVMLLIVGVRCFADTPEPKIQALAALPPKMEEAKTSADSKVKEGGVADVKNPDRVPVGMTINEVPSAEKSKKFWPAEVSLYPASDAPSVSSVREASTSTIVTFRQPNALRFLELPANLRRAMPVVQKKAASVVKIATTLNQPVNPAPARASVLPLPKKAVQIIPPAQAKELSRLFLEMRNSFWKSESALEKRAFDTNIPMERPERIAKFVPGMSPKDSISGGYYYCGEITDSFLRLAKKIDLKNDPRLPTVLYLGGLAHYTLGHYDRALADLKRLRTEFPEYQRYLYLNDRDPEDKSSAIPVAASLDKLILFLTLKNLPAQPADAFVSLKDVTTIALSALGTQQVYARWVSAKSDEFNIKTFDEGLFGSEPDQRRASALPTTVNLVSDAWDKLVEPAAQEAGGIGMRTFLRGQAQPGTPLAKLAAYHLDRVDALLLKAYFADAQKLLDAHDFDGARAKYKQIMAEYGGLDAASKAESELPRIKPIAVAYYKTEAEKHFQPVNKPGVAQTQGTEYFEKLLKEDPDSDYAAYYHSRCLATENKTAEALTELQELLKKHPDSEFEAPTLFLQGFLVAGQKQPDYNTAIAFMDQVVKGHPQSAEAPEALFFSASYLAWQSRFPEAISRLSQLDAYPNSIRYKWSKTFTTYLQKKIQKNEQWP